MNERPVITGRMVWGLIVLALGVLWTLDNLGMFEARQVVRWWPVVALAWGLLLLSGANGQRRPRAGWTWTAIGGLSMVRPLGIADADFTDFWPVLLILAGAMLFWRAWTGHDSGHAGVTQDGQRIDASAFLAGSQRKVVSESFSRLDVNSVVAGTTVDLRGAKLMNGQGLVDVYAMWGGIELIVPAEWRVVCDVTPILGVFQDSTVVPDDPAAPTLTVRGSAVMGGIDVRNSDERKEFRMRMGYGGKA